MSAKPGYPSLRRQAFIDPSRIAFVTFRNVEWATDSYVMVRVDALRKRPKEGRDAPFVPAKAIARVLAACRGGVGLNDTKATVHGQDDQYARVLYGHGRTVLLNPEVAAEWLDQEWDAITQADEAPVLFWAKRRGKRVLVGMVMPKYPGYGELRLARIDEPDEAAA